MNNIEILTEAPEPPSKQTAEIGDIDGTYEKIQEDPGPGNTTVFVKTSNNTKANKTKQKNKKTIDPEHVIFTN